MGLGLLGECSGQVVATRRLLSVDTLLGLQGWRLSVDTLSVYKAVRIGVNVDHVSTRQ